MREKRKTMCRMYNVYEFLEELDFPSFYIMLLSTFLRSRSYLVLSVCVLL